VTNCATTSHGHATCCSCVLHHHTTLQQPQLVMAGGRRPSGNPAACTCKAWQCSLVMPSPPSLLLLPCPLLLNRQQPCCKAQHIAAVSSLHQMLSATTPAAAQHATCLAHDAGRVRQKRERQPLCIRKCLVGRGLVAGDAKYLGSGLDKGLILVPELACLQHTRGSVAGRQAGT